MGARIIFSCSPPVHPSVVYQLYFTIFDILPKTWFLQSSRRLFVLHFHVSAGSCQHRLTTWDNYWIFWRSTKTPFRPMHLDFQREEDVCTETCDRIDTVITIVIKTVIKLVREPQPLICFTPPPSPPYQLILVLYPPPSQLFPSTISVSTSCTLRFQAHEHFNPQVDNLILPAFLTSTEWLFR